jgi:hypothetical protein
VRQKVLWPGRLRSLFVAIPGSGLKEPTTPFPQKRTSRHGLDQPYTRGPFCSFLTTESGFSSLKKLKLLRMNQAHRSAGEIN